MIRFMRNVAIFIVAAIVLVGFGLHFQRTSGGKIPAAGSGGHTADAHGHGKHDHAEGIELSDAKIAAAGIELATAAPGTLRDGLLLNGILQPNQEALVQVSPRFPGVVREVRKRIGDRVNSNEVLAKIESNQSLTTYELKAPIAGTIIDRQVALGEYVTEQKSAFTIADLSNVWVDFSVYRRDLNRVRVGDTITVDPEDGGPKIETKISYLSPVGSSDTQSALARAVLPNGELRLRPGLFVTGRLVLSAKPVNVAVKTSAIQTVENRSVVFVRVGEKFEPREVEMGARDSELVEILFGVLKGDVYAGKNSFVIKAEMAKGSATHEH